MDVTEATFQEEVIERSREIPVVVDFWAAWCGPCRQLAPVLEAAITRREGEVLLAKVDIDANPALAREYRIQSIPAVKGFRAGAAVAEFVGMQGPPAVDAFIDRLVPSRADQLVREGDEPSLREAITAEPGHVGARVALARLLLSEGRAAEVAEVVGPVEHDAGAAALLARAGLAERDDPDVAAGLAALQRGDPEASLTHLLDALIKVVRSTPICGTVSGPRWSASSASWATSTRSPPATAAGWRRPCIDSPRICRSFRSWRSATTILGVIVVFVPRFSCR